MISIIVPFYNTEKYIKQCLNSIKNQTFRDFECLIIDDGSTDSSREIAQKFVNEDSRFILLNKEHIGFPQAKNLGLDNAKGDYICFVDSDDYIHEQYLNQLYKNLISTNADICCCSYTNFNEHLTIRNPSLTPLVFEEDRMLRLFHPCCTYMWNKIYKKEIFDSMRFDNVEALSDTIICYKLFERAKRVAYIGYNLIFYRIHDENMTYRVRHFSPTYWEHRLNVYITMYSYLNKNYPQFSTYYKNSFSEQLEFIQPHLSEEIYNKYISKNEVRELLDLK